MKASDVVMGGTYAVKVSGRVVPVKLWSVMKRGWLGKNLDTGRFIHIKTAARLRHELRKLKHSPTQNAYVPA